MSNAREIVELLDRLGRLTRAVQYSECLNPAQWEALRFLSQANRYSRSPGALASFLGATKGTVSQTLSALEEKGLVVRMRSKTDRRAVDLELTESGEAMAKRDPLSALENTVARMDGETLGRTNAMLRELLQDIQARHQLRQFGVCWKCENFVPLDPAAENATGQLCGLTGEPLGAADSVKICMNFEINDAIDPAIDNVRAKC